MEMPDVVVAATVQDGDGEFMLIEAAEVLPQWVEEAPSGLIENRVFIRNGMIHLIPLPHTPALLPVIPSVLTVSTALRILCTQPVDTRASPPIQAAISSRLECFCTPNRQQSPETQSPITFRQSLHCTNALLPVHCALVLRRDPQFISLAIHALCEHTPEEWRVCTLMERFLPAGGDNNKSSGREVVVRIGMTHSHYAMLHGQRIVRPAPFGQLPAPDDILFTSAILGCKLACGFELAYQCSRRSTARTSPPTSPTLLARHIASTFASEVDAICSTNPDISLESFPPVDSLPQPDSDEWLESEPAAMFSNLERDLAQFQMKDHTAESAAEPASSLESSLSRFLNSKSDFQGIGGGSDSEDNEDERSADTDSQKQSNGSDDINADRVKKILERVLKGEDDEDDEMGGEGVSQDEAEGGDDDEEYLEALQELEAVRNSTSFSAQSTGGNASRGIYEDLIQSFQFQQGQPVKATLDKPTWLFSLQVYTGVQMIGELSVQNDRLKRIDALWSGRRIQGIMAVTFEFDATTFTLAPGEIVLALVVRRTTSQMTLRQAAFLRPDGKPLWRLYPLSRHTGGNCFSGKHMLYRDTYLLQFAIYHPERGFLWKGVMRQVVIPDKTSFLGVFEQGTPTTSNAEAEMGGPIQSSNETERDVSEEIGIAASATSNTACNRTFFFSGYIAATGRMPLFTTLSDVALLWRLGEIPVEEMISVGLAAEFTTYKLNGFYITTKNGIWDFQSTSEQETSEWLKRFKELKKEVFDPRVTTATDLGAERRQAVMPYNDEAPEKKVSLEKTIKNFAQTKAELTKIHSDTRVLCNSEPAEYPWPSTAIAILGDMKAGKSTLCNAILGDIVLPSRKLQCTGRVTVIKAGDTMEYTIKNPDGTVTEGPIQFNRELPYNAVVLTEDQKVSGASSIVEVHLPPPVETNAIGKEDAGQTKLPVSGFDFIDLPGLGESKELDAVVMNALKGVAGAIYILDVHSGAVKREDVDAIKTLLKTGIHKSVPILFVGNKADLLFEEEVEEHQETPDEVLNAFYSQLQALAPDILGHYPKRETSPYWAELSALRFLKIRCGKAVKDLPKYADLSQIFERRLQGLIGRTLDTIILRGCEGICGPCGMYADAMISFGELQHGIATCQCFVQQLKRGEEEIKHQCSNLVQQATRDTLVKLDAIAKEAVFNASQSKGILLSWPQTVERSTEFAFNQHLWATLKPMWRQFVSNFFKPISRHLRLVNNNLVDCISCDESRFPIWQIVIPLALEAVCSYDTDWKESHSKECLRCIDPVKEGNRVGKELARKLIENANILVKAKTAQLAMILKRWNPTQPTSTYSLAVSVSSKLLGLGSANGFLYGIPELKGHVYSDFYGETFDAVWRGVHVHAKKLNKFKGYDESQSVLKSILTQLCMSRIDTDPSFDIVKDHCDGSIFIVCSPEISEQLQAPPLDAIMIDVGLSDAIAIPPLVNLLQGVPTVSLDAALFGLHSEVGCTAECLAEAVALCRTKVIDEGLVTRASGNGSFVGEPMTTEEAAAIVLYTKNKPKVFAALNWALRDPHRTNASLAPWKPYTKLLLTALAKLKPVTDVVAYRGFGTLPESWETNLSPNRSTNICWYGFSSISRNRAVAVAFTAMQGQKGLLLEVRSPLAYDITGFSWFVLTEAELLTPPGCNFVLVSTDPPPAAPPPRLSKGTRLVSANKMEPHTGKGVEGYQQTGTNWVLGSRNVKSGNFQHSGEYVLNV
ncbi:ecdysoneless protein [Pelomyxa schiedti]|nr:ecdysoneless protein [Pelomyxa schiedti]